MLSEWKSEVLLYMDRGRAADRDLDRQLRFQHIVINNGNMEYEVSREKQVWFHADPHSGEKAHRDVLTEKRIQEKQEHNKEVDIWAGRKEKD